MTNEQREAIRQCELYVQAKATIQLVDRINDKLVFKSCDTSAIDTVLFLIKKQEKQLDLMAEYIANRDNDEDICRHQVAEWCKDEEDGVLVEVCRKCIKQYFANKVDSKIQ